MRFFTQYVANFPLPSGVTDEIRTALLEATQNRDDQLADLAAADAYHLSPAELRVIVGYARNREKTSADFGPDMEMD